MKFSFKIQQYQSDAVDAVVRVFEAPGPGLSEEFSADARYIRDLGTLPQKPEQDTLLPGAQNSSQEEDDGLGYKNTPLRLTDKELLANIQKIQATNNISLSQKLDDSLGRCSLDIEMETGTGKTYVYIKTMFELNKRYGWCKFIVVVPSIAIREGVKKSFEMTQDHFMECYGKKARFFVYNSSNLNQLDAFSSDAGINVMIINTQAFASSMNEDKNQEGRKGDAAARIIYSKRDEFGSRRPIDVIAANSPILILDEPQKMGKEDSATQKALKKFRPLFTLYYSATHAVRHDLVYVLDALDAYNKRLVKRIEVKGFEVRNLSGTGQYLYLDDILISPTKPPKARMEIEVAHNSGTKREFRILEKEDNLYYLSNNMEQYRGLVISDIDPFSGVVSFTNGTTLSKGQLVGDESENNMRRVQIRETIKSHFDKERELFGKGIKTLSLFFIDEVAKYRQYDDDGNEQTGEYGRIFEEEYKSVLEEYRTLYDLKYTAYLDSFDVHDVHKGYFSIDKKSNRMTDGKRRKGTDLSDDISAYDLILKDKERLLSFEEPTRFIFSHSALREGWDNPNVFQICTLKHSDSATQKRQEVGRGLRLCVNQDGSRMDEAALGSKVQDINVLTVIASESYASFVDSLQKQTEAVLFSRPRTASIEYFKGKGIRLDDDQIFVLDENGARAVYHYLIRNGYMDDDGHITDQYRRDTEQKCLKAMPESLQPVEDGVHKLVQAIYDDKLFASLIDDGHKPKLVDNPLNDRFKEKAFQNLWQEIKNNYTYTVTFDSRTLIDNSVKQINDELSVSPLQYTVTSAAQKENLSADMIRAGESFMDAKTRTQRIDHAGPGIVTYDLVGKIAEGTVLTRKTVAEILQGIKRSKFDMYKSNPEAFISRVVKIIRKQKAAIVVKNICYEPSGGSFDKDIFTKDKHYLPLKKAYPAKKAIQEYVFTDGMAEKSVEWKFAEDLDAAEEVNIFAKLPRSFFIPTPFGNYSPDWAVVFHDGKVNHIYFVAETKGSMQPEDLRDIERAKIDCARKLFDTMSDGIVRYSHVDSYQELLSRSMQ